jgi:photosystem II stability/assembly factor-like uncharacterized protein
VFVAAEFGAVFRSGDRGATWTELTTPYQGSYFGGLAAADGSFLVFGLRGHVFRSADDGETWQAVDSGTHASLMGGTRLPDDTLVVVGLAGTVLYSRDHGLTFRNLPRPDRLGLSAVAAADGRLLAVGESGIHPLEPPGRSP